MKTLSRSEKRIFPNLRKYPPKQIQETQRTLNRQDQKRNTPRHVILKTLSIHNEESEGKTQEKLLFFQEKKTQVTFKGKPIRITTD